MEEKSVKISTLVIIISVVVCIFIVAIALIVFSDDIFGDKGDDKNIDRPAGNSTVITDPDINPSINSDINSVPDTSIPSVSDPTAGIGAITPSNKYYPYFISAEDYVIPQSASRYLNHSDLQYMSYDQLVIARNEIYARHGYIFSNEIILQFFASKSWYKPTVPKADFDSKVFNDYENKNIKLIGEYEDIAKNGGNATIKPAVLDKSRNYKLQTDYFTWYVPNYWKEHCFIRIEDDCIRVYEKNSYYGVGGDFVISINVLETDEEYSYMPRYAEIGSITNKTTGKSYNVIAYYPSDVQFDMPYMDIYHTIRDDAESIKQDIDPKSDYQFNYYIVH